MNGSTKVLIVDLEGTHGTLVIFKGLKSDAKSLVRESKVVQARTRNKISGAALMSSKGRLMSNSLHTCKLGCPTEPSSSLSSSEHKR
jgi:hypothetical protein